MQIVWHTVARGDLSAIYEYILKDNPAAAKSTADTIRTVIEMQLPLFPLSGRLGKIDTTRELVVPKTPFVVLYTIIDEQIVILAIKHTSQQWPTHFLM
jgi:addiction module RelE/StbE family toxin